MNHNYKQLMKQYGGYIPFSKLVSSEKSKKYKKRTKRLIKKKCSIHTKRLIKKKRLIHTKRKRGGVKTTRNSRSRSRSSSRLSSRFYLPGTILRKNDQLYQLNSLKRWIKI